MNEIIILYLLALTLAGIFSMTALKMWYNLKIEGKLTVKVNGLLTEMGKLKSWKRDFMNGEMTMPESQGTQGAMPDLTNMTMEGAAEMLGLSKKEMSNPILKPIFEKVFNQLKSGQLAQKGNENETDIVGY